ncbi:MAG: hypothetical protein HQ538_04555 [Parcubacteria group bacterium]|nr:hypothetical protein [Parcubacteria group bacterium]
MAEEKKETCSCGQEFSENGFILDIGKLPVSVRKTDNDDDPVLLSVNEPFEACCPECIISGIRKGLKKYYTLDSGKRE